MMQARFPERTFDVGISEGHAVTFAGGLAKDGFMPYVAIYSSFLQRAYDHIVNDVALQNLPVTFCIDRAGIVGEDGATHHGALDLAYLSSIPGMVICAPRDEHYLRDLLYLSQSPDRKGTMAIRYPRGRGLYTEPMSEPKRLTIGKGEKLKDGKDVAVLSIGTLAENAQNAIARAEAEGISVAHYDMIFLKPIDESILREAATNAKHIITVEDASIKGGLGSAVIEWLTEHNLNNRVTRIGIPDKFVPQGSVSELHTLCGMDADSIYRAIVNANSN